MFSTSVNTITLSIIALGLMVLSPTARADGPAALAATEVDEIIVTTTGKATARRDNIGNIAIIDTQSPPSVFPADLVNQAPGVFVNRGNGQEHLTAIRSPVLTGGAGAGSFLIMEDGISFRAAPFANVNALMDSMSFDTARVEIIRGPGSALYGSNAVHGLINFITKDVRDDSHSLRLSYGSYGRYETSLSQTRQSSYGSTRLALSLTGEEQAYRQASGHQQRKLRVQHGWETSRATYRLSIGGMSLNQETAGYVEGQEAYRDKNLAKLNADADEAFRDAWSTLAHLDVDIPLDDGALLRIRPYLRANKMRFGMHFLPGDPIEDNQHHSFGFQLAYQTQTNDWSVIWGLDSEYSSGELKEVQNKPTIFGYEPGLHYDYRVDATVFAPYVHAEYAASPSTRLTLGLRSEITEYDYDNKTDDGNFGVGNKFFRPSDRSDNYTDWSPKIGVSHDLSPDTTVFFNIARGNRAPQTTDAYRLRVNQTVGDVKSESLTSLEAGLRGQLRALHYELTAYTMEKRNYYFRDSANNNVPHGRTRHVGLELDAGVTLGDDVELLAAMSYAEHKWDFSHIPAGNPRPENIIVSGDFVDSAPKTRANLRLNWKISEASLASFEWDHVGRYYLDAANLHDYDGHNIAHLGWQTTIGRGSKLALRIHNLFDRRYAKRADFNSANGQMRYFPGEPRHASMTFSQDF